MRAVGFDYPNTCPKIDKAITEAKSEIYKFLDDLLDEACPLLPTRVRKELAENYADSLYGCIESVFEDTRNANEEMRHEADSQISNLKSQLNDLELEFKSLQESIE